MDFRTPMVLADFQEHGVQLQEEAMTKSEAQRKFPADTVTLRCLFCGKEKSFALDSPEARGIFNFYCSGECEDNSVWSDGPAANATRIDEEGTT
jgi:hypothetical protein